MTEPKFTKGEWFAADGNTSGREVICPSAIKSKFRVARIGGPDRDANALLMSAAPDLYEALSDLISSLETEHVAVCLSQEIALARAALAKARGEA